MTLSQSPAESPLQDRSNHPIFTSGLSKDEMFGIVSFLDRRSVQCLMAVTPLRETYCLEERYCQKHGTQKQDGLNITQDSYEQEPGVAACMSLELVEGKDDSMEHASDNLEKDTNQDPKTGFDMLLQCLDCEHAKFGRSCCPRCDKFSENVGKCTACGERGCERYESCVGMVMCINCQAKFCSGNKCIGAYESCQSCFEISCFDCMKIKCDICGEAGGYCVNPKCDDFNCPPWDIMYKCGDCQKWFCDRCQSRGFCNSETCQRDYCLECRSTFHDERNLTSWCDRCKDGAECSVCDFAYLKSDTVQCSFCDKTVCDGCVDTSPDGHMYDCEFCDKRSCQSCKQVVFCGCCDVSVCRSCADTCGKCQRLVCANSFACQACGKEVCERCRNLDGTCNCKKKGDFALIKSPKK